MSSEVSDTATEVEQEEAPRPNKRRPALEPGSPYAISTVLWVLMVVGMARNPYHVPGEPGTRNQRGVAWVDLALLVLVVAVIAGAVYIVDQRRRRTHHPLGYRHPQRTRPSVVEVLSWLFLVVYTLGVVASIGWLAMIVVNLIPAHEDSATWALARASFLPVLLLIYGFHLIVLPWAGVAFLLKVRHQRQYPDPTHRDTPGFRRTTKTLLAVDAILVVLIVLVEVLIPASSMVR